MNVGGTGKVQEFHFPQGTDEIWKKMGLNSGQFSQVKNFIENNKYLIGTGESLTEGLPRRVTFLNNGHVIIDTEGNKKEEGAETVKGHENDRRAWDATSGELCFVIDKVKKEQFKDPNFTEMGSYQIVNDQFFVLEKMLQEAIISKKSAELSIKSSEKEQMPPQSIVVKFPKNKDDLYNKIGSISDKADLIKASIEKNYPKHINSEKVQSGGQKFIKEQLSATTDWLPTVTILKNGAVIIELKDEGHLKGKNLVYEVRSGKRYKAVEMSEAEWEKHNEMSKKEKIDTPVFHFKTTNKGGKGVICVLFDEELNKSVEEASSLGIKLGQGWNPVPLPHEFIYRNEGVQEKKGPPYNIEFPTEPAGWHTKNKVGVSEKGPNKIWGLNSNKETVYRVEGEKTHVRATSELWKSDYIENVSGIEFTGSIKKQENEGHYNNHFAIFFHTDKFYEGGYEYGWAFREKTGTAQFYIEGEANINDLVEVQKEDGQIVNEKIPNPNHIWRDWPKKESGGGFTVFADEGFEEMLTDGKVRTWKIQVLKNGDFHLQITDLETQETKKCTVRKPDQFPNLHGEGGYVTINAQKFENTPIDNPRVLEVKQIKTWKADIY